MSRRQTIGTLMFGYWVVGVAASLCFAEGGTDRAHRLVYFIAGNVLGISSTVFLMGVYARMNVNLGMAIATSGVFILFQLTLWAVYRAPVTAMQWLGVLVVGAGIVLALPKDRSRVAKRVPEEALPSAAPDREVPEPLAVAAAAPAEPGTGEEA